MLWSTGQLRRSEGVGGEGRALCGERRREAIRRDARRGVLGGIYPRRLTPRTVSPTFIVTGGIVVRSAELMGGIGGQVSRKRTTAIIVGSVLAIKGVGVGGGITLCY